MPVTRHPYGSDGFTLVELLVGVLIIGLLAAIAVPSFASQSGKAEAAAVRQGLADAATALEACRVERGAYDACRSELSTHFDDGADADYTASLAATTYVLAGRTAKGAVFTVTRDASGMTRACAPAPVSSVGCRDGVW